MGKKKVPRASEGKKHVATIVPRKTVDRLFLYDGVDDGIRKMAPIYAEKFLKFDKNNIKPVKTWKEFGKVLKQYERIGDLFIDFHGSPGSIKVGIVIKSFSKVISDDLQGAMPVIGNKIDFESCNVGLGPDELIGFAKHLKAPKVLAWNYYHVFNKINVNIPSGATVEGVRKVLKPYEGYLTEGNETPEEMAKKPGKHTLFAEWFREDDNAEKLDPTNRRTFRRRQDANKRTIKSSEAAALRKEYDDAPVKPLDHVTVTIE